MNNKEALTNKSETLKLSIILIICLIVLLVLSVAVVQSFTKSPASNTGNPQYIEIPNLEGMKLAEAKALLEGASIQYEIVPTTSKTPNKVENVEYTGKTEDAKVLVEIGTTVKLHANEVGKDKIIYLTFDDGPTRDNSNAIVLMLEKYGIKASFFCTGKNISLRPDRIEAMLLRGHIVACHSQTHEYEDIYFSTDAFITEVKQYESALMEVINESDLIDPDYFNQIKKIIRFPGGTNNSYLSGEGKALSYISAVRALGYSVYDWTALTGDAVKDAPKDPQTLVSNLASSLSKVKNAGLDLIVLMHDNVYTNEALEDILDYLIAEGYYFDTIDNCPEYTFIEN